MRPKWCTFHDDYSNINPRCHATLLVDWVDSVALPGVPEVRMQSNRLHSPTHSFRSYLYFLWSFKGRRSTFFFQVVPAKRCFGHTLCNTAIFCRELRIDPPRSMDWVTVLKRHHRSDGWSTTPSEEQVSACYCVHRQDFRTSLINCFSRPPVSGRRREEGTTRGQHSNWGL